MSLIAEYRTHLTQLGEALDAVSDVAVRHEDIFFTPDDDVKWFFWVDGDDLDAFDAALGEDSSVASYDVLTELGDRDQRLYRATLVGSPEDFTLTVFAELDIQILDATHAHDGTSVRVRCPSREAYATLKEAVGGKYGTFTTQRLYEEDDADEARLGVTAQQREALEAALDAGYYDVPRGTTLAELADDLGISDQALSSRLRRGTAALLRNTLEPGSGI